MTKSYHCILCGNFIVGNSEIRENINSEIFNHFCTHHEEDTKIRAEDIFKDLIKMDEE